jgi:hypothetical protein
MKPHIDRIEKKKIIQKGVKKLLLYDKKYKSIYQQFNTKR